MHAAMSHHTRDATRGPQHAPRARRRKPLSRDGWHRTHGKPATRPGRAAQRDAHHSTAAQQSTRSVSFTTHPRSTASILTPQSPSAFSSRLSWGPSGSAREDVARKGRYPSEEVARPLTAHRSHCASPGGLGRALAERTLPPMHARDARDASTRCTHEMHRTRGRGGTSRPRTPPRLSGLSAVHSAVHSAVDTSAAPLQSIEADDLRGRHVQVLVDPRREVLVEQGLELAVLPLHVAHLGEGKG